MNIVLMGYRCTGKTSAGRMLADRLGVAFHDTDDLVAGRADKPVRELVASEGWPVFRELEKEVIGDLAGTDGSVISLGGGAVLDAQNVEALKEKGLFVWLFADAETIMRRLEEDQSGSALRPSLTGKPVDQEVPEVLGEREPIYRRIADLVVDTSRRTVEEVAAAIGSGLEKRLSHRKGSLLKREDRDVRKHHRRSV
jgi:shikimate kinase